MKKVLLLLFSILISLQSSGHRYWKYENNSSPNHHPRVSRIYVITEDGSYVNFSGGNIYPDNCSDLGSIPGIGSTYTVDLGSANKVQGYGFYNTYEPSSRTTIASLYYSDDNYSWTQLEHQQITTDRGCGEYNRNVELNRNVVFKIVCVGTTTQVKNNLIYLLSMTKPFTGSSSCKYENGQIQSIGNIKDGKKVGKWTFWNKHGQLESERDYGRGRQNHSPGKWTTWYENGQLESEINYKDGKNDGKWTTWYENGQIQSTGNIKDGKNDGKWTTWYENGQLESEANYKDGDAVNRTQFKYSATGQKEEELNYKDGDAVIRTQFKYSATGQKKEELNYKDGDLVSRTQFKYYDNNQIKSEKHYKDDKSDGKWTTWYENGQLESEKHYKDGKTNGKSIFWYENGQKFIDGSYKDDKPDGKWTFWRENGQKEEELNYKDGDLVDRTIFKYSYFTGHLKSKKKYKDGKCISGDC